MKNETTTWEYRLQKAVRWQTEDAIDDVVHFIKTKVVQPEWFNYKKETPPYEQKCWVIDKNGDLYLAKYKRMNTFFGKPNGGHFTSAVGRQWHLSEIKIWTPLILPT